MKTVGILTFYLNHNYGTTLQCYALKKAIASICECEVNIIPHTFVDKIENGFGEPYLFEKYNRRIQMFDDFLKNNIGCRHEHISHLTAENAPKYDYYIVGSDTIWNTIQTGNDSAYFLDFAMNIDAVKVAYAPSLGVSNTNLLNRNLFEKYIDKFDFLSIRESKDIDFINKFTDKKVERVLDPTYLLKKEDYIELIDTKRKKEKGFIFVYLIYEDTENIQKVLNYVNRISLEKDLDVIHFIYNIPDYIFEDRGKSFAFDGPKDFLWYVNNADMIITNSFHGIAFSIIFRKAFYALVRSNGSNKITSILKEFGLESRIFNNSLDINSLDFNLDYNDTEIKINQLMDNSYLYLKNALNATLM